MQDSLHTLSEFQQKTKEEMIETYRITLIYISELHVQIEQLEKSAVDLIVEKDQIIEQLELQLQHSSRRPSFNNYEEVTQYKNHIADLQQRLDQLQNKHYEQLQEQEKMWNQYLLDQISQSQQTVDQKLKNHLDQIFYLEDKINKLENDIEIKENFQITFINQIKQLKELNGTLEDEQMLLNRQLLKIQIEMEQLQSFNIKEKNQLIEQLNSTMTDLTSLQQQISSYKQQNQKLSNQNKIFSNTISDLMLKKTELESIVSSNQKQQQQECNGFHSVKTEAQTIEQQNEAYFARSEINTTAFDMTGETYEINQELISFQIDDTRKCNQSRQSEKCETKQPDMEKCLFQSNQFIKQQNARLQLLNQQLQLVRKSQLNSNNVKEYLKIMEENYNSLLKLNKDQITSFEQKISLLGQENQYLKQKIKQYSQRLLKTHKKYSTNQQH